MKPRIKILASLLLRFSTLKKALREQGNIYYSICYYYLQEHPVIEPQREHPFAPAAPE